MSWLCMCFPCRVVCGDVLPISVCCPLQVLCCVLQVFEHTLKSWASMQTRDRPSQLSPNAARRCDSAASGASGTPSEGEEGLPVSETHRNLVDATRALIQCVSMILTRNSQKSPGGSTPVVPYLRAVRGSGWLESQQWCHSFLHRPHPPQLWRKPDSHSLLVEKRVYLKQYHLFNLVVHASQWIGGALVECELTRANQLTL